MDDSYEAYIETARAWRARRHWLDRFGAISRDKVVHHLDGVPTNNELDNLVVVDLSENVRAR
jgi:hypothetical protein